MGIIKATTGAVGGVLADQWLEMYYCDSIPQGILAQKGSKRIGPNSSNTKGSEDVISDGSIIVVNEGQCALVVEMGKVISVHDKPGENVFHSDRSPSIFSGKGLKGMGKSIIDRVGFGGDVNIHQAVVYLDLKEHFGSPFSLSCPVNVRDEETGLELTATVQMSGRFSFKITDPLTFYRVVCFNSAGTVSLHSVQPQLEAEFNTAAMEAVGQICADGITPSDLPAYAEKIADRIKECMTQQWISLRGFTAVSVAVSQLQLLSKDLKTLQTFERDKMLRDPTMAAATLIGTQAQAMEMAAQNPGGGVGFVGVNPVSNAAPSQPPKLWYCATCGKFCSSRFCPDCGAQRQDG